MSLRATLLHFAAKQSYDYVGDCFARYHLLTMTNNPKGETHV